MQKRRKVIRPRKYLAQKLKGRKLTRQRVGKLHADMQSEGYVCSSPVSAPPDRTRVWVKRHDPWAIPARLAASEEILPKAELRKLMGSPDKGQLPIADLSNLGIVAVPLDPTQVRLLGTSPPIARLVNRIHHGMRRCRLTKKEFVQIMKDGQLQRVKAVTLMKYLLEAEQRFRLDLSGLISHNSILI